MVHELSREQARRIAVRAQLLDLPRPTEPLEVIRRLTRVQVDLTTYVAPSADLVLWSRIGASYAPADLEALLLDRAVVELLGMLRPGEDIALHRADMAAWPGRGELRDWQVEIRQWVQANEACRQELVQLLRAEGPLPARELPDSCTVPWRSTGWTDGRNVLRLLGFLEARGEVAVSSRENRERVWDLAERVYPDLGTVPAEEADRERDRRRLQALGVARARPRQAPIEPEGVGDAGEPAVIDGVRGRWRVDPDQLDRPFEGRAALLSHLDGLVKDRKRMTDVFEFDYQLEMYKPAAGRRWGYWAMPILYGDRLVGKLDAEADREAGALFVHAVHEDVPFDPAMRAEVDQEIRGLAKWLELELEAD